MWDYAGYHWMQTLDYAGCIYIYILIIDWISLRIHLNPSEKSRRQGQKLSSLCCSMAGWVALPCSSESWQLQENSGACVDETKDSQVICQWRLIGCQWAGWNLGQQAAMARDDVQIRMNLLRRIAWGNPFGVTAVGGPSMLTCLLFSHR